jgi:hypothetical protein
MDARETGACAALRKLGSRASQTNQMGCVPSSSCRVRLWPRRLQRVSFLDLVGASPTGKAQLRTVEKYALLVSTGHSFCR